jgi:hypothetical protein
MGEAVEFTHVAVPKVESCALLIVALAGSDTDQVTFIRFDAVVEHPDETPPQARKLWLFPVAA